MLRSRSLVFVLALVTPLAAFAFEGTVNYQVKTDDGKTQNLDYQVKGEKLRLNMHSPENGDHAMIIDRPDNQMIILMPDKKMAMKRPLPNPSAPTARKSTGKKPVFTKTGRTETIAGHKCTVYTYSSEGGSGEVCSAEGLGRFYFGNGGPRGGEQPAWQQEAVAKGFFPLRVNHKEAKSGKTFSMVATKITPGSLSNSLFEIPAGYQEMAGFGGPGATGAPSGADFRQKMMNATPEERQKMIEQMKKQYGAK